MSTHIEAKKEDISKIVIMCGDPLRAEFIAQNYLKEYGCINKVRNMLGFTGFYNNKKISVMSHGMGNPSMGIYSYELFKDYDVDVIIRLGTAGSYTSKLDINDILLVKEAFSDSIYAYNQSKNINKIISSDNTINELILKQSKLDNVRINISRVYSTDVFYTKNDITDIMREKYGCDAVEMECFSLFHNAKELNKKATCLLTVSDSFISKRELNSEEREKSLTKMIELALSIVNNI